MQPPCFHPFSAQRWRATQSSARWDESEEQQKKVKKFSNHDMTLRKWAFFNPCAQLQASCPIVLFMLQPQGSFLEEIPHLCLGIFLIQSTPGVWFYSCLCFAPELLQGLVAFKRRFFIDMCLDDYDSFQHCQPPVLCLQRALFAYLAAIGPNRLGHDTWNHWTHFSTKSVTFADSSVLAWHVETSKSGGKTAKDTLFAS